MNKEILKEVKCKKLYDCDMTNLNSYKLKFKTKCLIYPENVEQLKKIIEICNDNNIQYKIIGDCSNLIFVKDYEGILIKLDKLNKIEFDKNKIYVEAGYNLRKLALKSIHMNLTGLEFAAGIPGCVGAAVYNNSGAYNSDMGYIVESVEVLTPTLKIEKMYNKDLNYHYRDSFFKRNKGFICLRVTLALKRGNVKESMKLIEDRKQRRIMSQPLEYPSAGSVFRNPKDMHAGKLIEDLGYKGYEINGACVSSKHANFIINKGNAKGNDIVELINKIKVEVKQKYDIDLVLEQEIVNE